ncbi:Clavaminate synthase-like protein [Aspergillus ruber CBS 135680]|uniref:Clavaminate synthase-like protein n=1 Tax=Aspergillus ruber (strain CBS 135680) TaxID=1388766 RepID=A0A017SPW7_ASPRC|nr:Clavaminate synthase-like protein [Aspergillus ruber CBS 135680]EYE98649.1 Clavaminate synthase-like protein [Aspergillus ruber CBS 135680]
MDFTTVPVLDLSLAGSLTRTEPQFLPELRNALSVQRNAIQQAAEFFDLSLDKKLEMETVKSKHFLGYNIMASEKTAAEIDYNESIALAPDHPVPDPNDPVYLNVQGPNQWPDEAAVPKFRNVFETYLSVVQLLAANFTSLIAKALNLEPNALTRFLHSSLSAP